MRKEKEESKNEVANTVTEDGVWMAIADISEDESMEWANNEFDDFAISDDELFFEDEDEEEIENVLRLTSDLKRLLKISDPSQNITYPYDNPEYFLDPRNFIDLFDDEEGAVAMKA